jgi:hypothetical protein
MNGNFWNGFEKRAKLTLDDIEDDIGFHLTDRADQRRVEEAVGRANDASIALRHPILTGIPTLGIWPAIARGNASSKIRADLFRNSRNARSLAQEVERRRAAQEAIDHQREVDLMQKHIEERRRESHEEMMRTGVVGALAGLHTVYNNKKNDETK